MKRFPLLAGALLLLGSAPGVRAQEAPAPAPLSPPRAFAGGSVVMARPQGEFADFIDQGWGLDGHFLYALDRDGIVGLRVEGGFLEYGRERQRVPLSSTIGGRVLVNVNTSNDIFFLGVGPQLLLPNGRLRPYLNGTLGFSYFVTQSSVEGTRDREDFASTTNFDDWTLSYAAGAGLYIPVKRGRAPISIDLGVRYQNNGRVRYLREGSIRDDADGGISFTPIESQANLLAFQLGVTATLRNPQKHRR